MHLTRNLAIFAEPVVPLCSPRISMANPLRKTLRRISRVAITEMHKITPYRRPHSSLEFVETNRWDSTHYRRSASFVHELAGAVVDLLNPQPGESILDLGCGEGSLSKALQDAGCRVIGVDGSQSMVDAAKAAGVEAYRMDGQNLTFDSEFDAVFSNAAMHWMSRDPTAVVQGAKRALRPGGRFVAEFGGHGNLAAITTALHAVVQKRGINAEAVDPWYFPPKEEYRDMLEGEGFSVDMIESIPRPTLLPIDLKEFLDICGRGFFQTLPLESHDKALDEVVELLRPILQRHDGKWTADYVRLRFKATLTQ
ncbi:hypothetical protein BSKO_07954 [Bryopsis sp. KO-2023]|nr:hypothetical protein BSKO_07954 [Bryopsis sp. KO-2023]